MPKYFIFILLMGCCAAMVAQETVIKNIRFNNTNRNYRLRIPPQASENNSLPLVFNMHGFTSNALQQELYSDMNNVADTAGFFVCYPNGVGNAWNVGWSFGSTADDVGFLSMLIDSLSSDYPIDLERVYACGMSNGGFMSFRLACELNSKIAAIASVTGSMVNTALNNCKPQRSVPILQIHGTADNVVNYNGSPFISEPIEKILDFWRENNLCSINKTIQAVPDTSADNTTTEIWEYDNCQPDGSVLHFKVFNGGHTWPGGNGNTGTTSRDFHASTEIWKFFKKFTLASTPSSVVHPYSNPKIYPNPCIHDLNILTDLPSKIIIADINGNIIYEQMSTQGLTTINTSDMVAGIYIIGLESDKTTTHYRFIKI